MKYGNRSLTKKIISSPLSLVAVLILFVILVKATWSIHQKAAVSSQRLSQAQTELAKLEAHQKDLANQISYLSTDQGVEAELRTKYRAVKAGESVAVIVDKDQQAQVIQASSTAAVSASWWQKVLHFFGLWR
jgi:cell division protein FtsB